MKRLAEQQIYEWYEDPSRTPLVIRGARQVGKSTLVKNFCNNNNIELIEINLEKNRVPAFDLESINTDRIISDIEALTRKEIDISKKQILFIDEIQTQPSALRSLRYFLEEKPEIAVIAAGSLLEFLLNDKKIDFPVGRVTYLKLGPMSFTEFLMALDETTLLKKMSSSKNLTGSTHQELMKLYRLFIFIGGMPKAVLTYRNTKKLGAVRKIQKNLLESYKDDFIKYTKKETVHLLVNTVFDYTTYNLGRKIKYSEISADNKALAVRNAIELLSYARIITPVYHSNATGLPLSAQKESKIFKLYFLDVGLITAATNLPFEDIDDDSLLEGPLAEQFIAQHINYHFNAQIHDELFYWLKDKSTSKAEVDFVLQDQKFIIPIEVKSGTTVKMKSLHLFCIERSSPLGVIASANPYGLSKFTFKIYDGHKNVSHQGHLLQIPLYFIEYLRSHLATIRSSL